MVRACATTTSLFDMGRHDKPSSYWKVKENLGASFPTDPVVPYAPAENRLLGGK